MAVLAPTLFTARNNQLPIETARAIAILLLVAYHVIGAGPDAGLRIGYPAPLRLFADFFVDLRMPLFALIAGMVFAMKPPEPSGLDIFFSWQAAPAGTAGTCRNGRVRTVIEAGAYQS